MPKIKYGAGFLIFSGYGGKNVQHMKSQNAFSNNIAFFALYVSISLTSCGFLTIERHRPVMFYDAEYLFTDTNGDTYVMIGLNHLLKHNPEIKNDLYYYRYCETRLDGEKDSKNIDSYKSIMTNHDSIIACEHYLDNGFVDKIEIFDKTLKLKKTHFLKDGTLICDAVSTDNYIYLLVLQETRGKKQLLRVDLNTFEEDVLINNVSNYQFYLDDDVHLFYDDSNIERYSDKTKLLLGWDKENGRSYFFTDKYKLYLSNQMIRVENDGSAFDFSFSNPIEQLYNKAFIINEKLLFAGLHYKPDESCITNDYNESTPCVCGLKESFLFVYDLKLNELVSTQEFKSGTYLIDFDLESAKYYYDGGLYVGDSLIRKCENVKKGETIKLNRLENYREEWDKRHYHLCYNNGEFYGI